MSLLDHTTEPPTGTCTSRDENLKSATPTATDGPVAATVVVSGAAIDVSAHAPTQGSKSVVRRSHLRRIAMGSERLRFRIGRIARLFDTVPARE